MSTPAERLGLVAKCCSKCGQRKALGEFQKNPKGKCGRRGDCKQCRSDYAKSYREKNRDKLMDSERRYYEEHREQVLARQAQYREENHDKVLEGQRRWYQENRDEERERSRRRYAENPKQCHEWTNRWREENREQSNENVRRWRERNHDKVLESDRRYREEHPEYRRLYHERNPHKRPEYDRRRRARRVNAQGDFSQAEWMELCEAYDNVCLRCGEATSLTQDHVIPLSRGGSNYIENIQPLCRPCNSHKGVGDTDYRLRCGEDSA